MDEVYISWSDYRKFDKCIELCFFVFDFVFFLIGGDIFFIFWYVEKNFKINENYIFFDRFF